MRRTTTKANWGPNQAEWDCCGSHFSGKFSAFHVMEHNTDILAQSHAERERERVATHNSQLTDEEDKVLSNATPYIYL